MAGPKEKIWLAEYYKCWNATRAAKRAKYKWPNKQGPRLLQKFADEIKAHVEEIQMDADEVLIRLGDQARGDIGDFANIENSSDLANHPLSRIVKRYKKRIYHPKNADPYEEIELELYDAHAPLVDIGKNLGLFKERIEQDIKVSGKLVILPKQDE